MTPAIGPRKAAECKERKRRTHGQPRYWVVPGKRRISMRWTWGAYRGLELESIRQLHDDRSVSGSCGWVEQSRNSAGLRAPRCIETPVLTKRGHVGLWREGRGRWSTETGARRMPPVCDRVAGTQRRDSTDELRLSRHLRRLRLPSGRVCSLARPQDSHSRRPGLRRFDLRTADATLLCGDSWEYLVEAGLEFAPPGHRAA